MCTREFKILKQTNWGAVTRFKDDLKTTYHTIHLNIEISGIEKYNRVCITLSHAKLF